MASAVGTSRLDMAALGVTQAKAGHWGSGWASRYLTTIQAMPYIASFSTALRWIYWPVFLLTSQGFLLQSVVWAQTPKQLLQRILLVSSSTQPCGASCFLAAPWCLLAFSQEVLKNLSQTIGLACCTKYPSCLSMFQIIYHNWSV